MSLHTNTLNWWLLSSRLQCVCDCVIGKKTHYCTWLTLRRGLFFFLIKVTLWFHPQWSYSCAKNLMPFCCVETFSTDCLVSLRKHWLFCIQMIMPPPHRAKSRHMFVTQSKFKTGKLELRSQWDILHFLHSRNTRWRSSLRKYGHLLLPVKMSV